MTYEIFLDTSTDRGLLALWQGDRLIEEREVPAGPLSSPSLFPAIEQLLDSHALRLRQVERFSAGIGPGSFTGIRVAVSIQQSLAFAFGRQWEGVGSLGLWLPLEEGEFVAMVDARSGGIYCQAGCWCDGILRIDDEPARRPVDQAAALANRYAGRVVTPHADLIRARLPMNCCVEQVAPSSRALRSLIREQAPLLAYAGGPTLPTGR